MDLCGEPGGRSRKAQGLVWLRQKRGAKLIRPSLPLSGGSPDRRPPTPTTSLPRHWGSEPLSPRDRTPPWGGKSLPAQHPTDSPSSTSFLRLPVLTGL
jgi:hypothetical protein